MNKRLLVASLALVIAIIGAGAWYSFADTSNAVLVDQATLDAIQKFDPDVAFLTSKDNPIQTLRGLTHDEIVSWSGRAMFDGEFDDKVRAFQKAIGMPDAGTVSTYGIGKGHTKISEIKAYISQKSYAYLLPESILNQLLDDAIRVKFKKE